MIFFDFISKSFNFIAEIKTKNPEKVCLRRNLIRIVKSKFTMTKVFESHEIYKNLSLEDMVVHQAFWILFSLVVFFGCMWLADGCPNEPIEAISRLIF